MGCLGVCLVVWGGGRRVVEGLRLSLGVASEENRFGTVSSSFDDGIYLSIYPTTY